MKIALCQLNPIMGDIAGNTERVAEALAQSSRQSPDLVVFPELFIQGYPPRDLLEHDWFIEQGHRALDRVCEFSRRYPGVGILVGTAVRKPSGEGKGLLNAAVLIVNGEIRFTQGKSLLPTYDVFDETRYFDTADEVSVFAFKGETLGITVCEDAWNAPGSASRPRYAFDPVARCAALGATVLVNISASPFHMGKQRYRYELFRAHARAHGIPFVFVNQTGGHDELIFDGSSKVLDVDGEVRELLPSFAEEIRVIDIRSPAKLVEAPVFDTVAAVYDALVMGVADYLHKCGFRRAVVGLSGGIDSAVTCALAVDALGAENVLGVAMPSRYSSEGSKDDARSLAVNLGIEFKIVAIEPMFAAFLEALEPHFAGLEPDVTEENIQARIRGNLLMAFSNKFGALLLSTGNKSEMAVGYCTLYGDMSGGLSVISDVPKTKVYEIASYINRDKERIPSATITKPPSAELKQDQKDSDSLPSYEVLDPILEMLVEQGASVDQVRARGYDGTIVEWVASAVAGNEYKRRQAAPGLKVSPKAFGVGRRFPIAAKYVRKNKSAQDL
ncbi:MAG: NAD+ synthase [Chitinivibrionales bacterium]|nr:NAD+ synthase [Chitinivibrionales bacterium]